MSIAAIVTLLQRCGLIKGIKLKFGGFVLFFFFFFTGDGAVHEHAKSQS